MRHCDAVGRPPLDELLRQLRRVGEALGEPHAYEGEVACEPVAGHGGSHAAYLCEIDPDTQLWVLWDAAGFTYALLPPCPARGPREDTVCHLFDGHEPGHSWELGACRSCAGRGAC